MQSEEAWKANGKFRLEKLRVCAFAPVVGFMLRISRIESSPDKVILRLEGRLIGAWVDELQCCCAAVCNQGANSR